MCLAIYKKEGALPDWGALEEGFKSNKDGAGFVCVSDGKLIVSKGHFTFDDFRQAYSPYADLQSAIHFRWATHGKTDELNCHPFMVTDDLALIHNGVLSIKCDLNDSMSDTWHYVQHILTPLAERDPDFFWQPEMRFLGEAAIGGNKFVFLRSDGEYDIWNEGDGHWVGGIWYSNTSYKSRVIGYTTRWTDKGDRWWERDEEKPVISVPDSLDESKWDQWLTAEQRWAYEDLLEDGFSVAELDQIVFEEGGESLVELLEDLALKEGNI